MWTFSRIMYLKLTVEEVENSRTDNKLKVILPKVLFSDDFMSEVLSASEEL